MISLRHAPILSKTGLSLVVGGAVAIAFTFVFAHPLLARPQTLPTLNTYFQFRSEDSSEGTNDRTTALFGIAVAAKYKFGVGGFGGDFSIKYDGTIQDDEFILSAVNEARANQKYKVNLSLASSDGALGLSSEFATKDTYTRRSKFDALLASDTYQSFTTTAVVNKPPYPIILASVTSERSMVSRKNSLSSSRMLAATVAADWTNGPFRIIVNKVRSESKTDLTPNPATVGEQTQVNVNGFFPLGPNFGLTNNFRYVEDASSSFYGSGEPSKSRSTFAQLAFTGENLTTGLSAKAELNSDWKTFSAAESNSQSISQNVNLNYKLPGEILGDDILSFTFTNSDFENSGRNINVRQHAIGWRFAPFKQSSVAINYKGRTTTDSVSESKSDERSNFDLRLSYQPGKFALDSGYSFDLVEGARGQESRTNSIYTQMGYKVSEPLAFSLRFNQWENRNVPANPFSTTNISEKYEWQIGAHWQPVANISVDGGFNWLTQDNSASAREHSKSIQFRLNYAVTSNIKLTVDFKSNDFSQVDDPGQDRSNTVLQTMLTVEF